MPKHWIPWLVLAAGSIALAQDAKTFRAGYEEGIPPAEYEKKGCIVANLEEVTRIFSGDAASRQASAEGASNRAYLEVTVQGVLYDPDDAPWYVKAAIVTWNEHIGTDISPDKKARLIEEASYMKYRLGKWKRTLDQEQVKQLRAGGSIEVPVRGPFRLIHLWSPRPSLVLTIRGRPGPRAIAIRFFQRRPKELQEVEKLHVRGAFYVKVTFDKRPKQRMRQVKLSFDNGQTANVTVSSTRELPKVLGSGPKHLTQLARFPSVSREDSSPSDRPAEKTDPKAPKYVLPYRMTARLRYEEVIEGAPKGGSTSVTASIDDLTKRVPIVQVGGTKHATLDIPLRLNFRKRKGSDPDTLYLTVGGHQLTIDEGMPAESAAAIRQETTSVEKRLKDWRQPLDEAPLKKQWIDEGMVTVKIEQPFEELKKLSKPDVTLSLERPLELEGDDLAPVIKLLYARLMQKHVLEKRMSKIMKRLKKGNADVENGTKLLDRLDRGTGVGEAGEIGQYLRDYAWALKMVSDGPFDPTKLQKKLDATKAKIPKLERELKEKESKVLVKPKGWGFELARRRGPGVRNAVGLRDSLRRKAKTLKEGIRTNPVGEQRRKELERKIKQMLADAAAIQKIIDGRTDYFRKEIARLKGEVEELQVKIAEGEEADRRAREEALKFRKQWWKKQAAYSALTKDVQGLASSIQDDSLKLPRLPKLAASTSGLKFKKLNSAADALADLRHIVASWHSNQMGALKADLAAYINAQRSYGLRMKKVVYAMKEAVQRARGACTKGSFAEEKTYQLLAKELGKVKGAIDEAESLVSTLDSRLDKFQTLLKYLDSKQGESLLKKVREEMEVLGNVAKKFKTYSGYADTIMKLVKLHQEGTPKDFLKVALEMGGTIAQRLPVRGAVVGAVLGVYATVGAACLDAAYRLQDRLIKDELAAAYDKLKGKAHPRYRLYTRGDIRTGVLHGLYAHTTKEKVIHLAVMWQLQRLMFLLSHGNNEALIKDQGGLRY